MNIRKATIDDLPQLAQLFDGFRVFYQKASDTGAAFLFLKERMLQGESEIFVAENETGLCGFTQLYPLFSSTRMKRLWLLNDLYVAPSFRGKGISKQLIEAAKNLCRQTNACAVMLETAKSNLIGNNLYPALGFELNTEFNFYEWPCA